MVTEMLINSFSSSILRFITVFDRRAGNNVDRPIQLSIGIICGIQWHTKIGVGTQIPYWRLFRRYINQKSKP